MKPLSFFPAMQKSLIGALLAMLPVAHASLPEPDNVIYGSIVISNQPVTAAQSSFIVEAQRTLGGPALASYRMGSDPGLGSFYSLRLKIESVPPSSDTNASQIGDNVFIVVRDNTGIRAQTTYAFTDRGLIQRLDFGAPVDDVDDNGLPDVWELAHFHRAGGGANLDSDNDGLSNAAEYHAGTDPLDPGDAFRVEIARAGAQTTVSFFARRAHGPGYEGLTRFYSLQSVPDLNGLSWTGVAGVTNIAGSDQAVAYSPGPGPQEFFRGMVSLSAAVPTIPDTNGLPDAWETLYFGSVGQDPDADPDLDGRTTRDEFVAGTNPSNSDDGFRISITSSGGLNSISFLARKAEGTGYSGLTRIFTLETTTNLHGAPWIAVPGAQSISGNNQTAMYQSPSTNSPSFFRARVQLQGP